MTKNSTIKIVYKNNMTQLNMLYPILDIINGSNQLYPKLELIINLKNDFHQISWNDVSFDQVGCVSSVMVTNSDRQ